MRIIQSHWSKPSKNKQLSDNDKLYHYSHLFLSCLKYSEFYPLELITDKEGKELFIDILKLPYKKVDIVLDDINHYPSIFWALGKIYTYSLQKDPFLHVDNDSYIWKPFPNELLEKDLIVQTIEYKFKFNTDYFNSVKNILINIPNCISTFQEKEKEVIEINAGIIGGNDMSFFKKYVQIAFDFVDSNKNNNQLLSMSDPGYFNTIFEQYLFYCLAQSEHKEISCLLPQEQANSGLHDFFDIPHNKSFMHCLGSTKREPAPKFQMIQRFWYEYPKQYNMLLDLIKYKII